ncbi:DUF2529 domain-containing protein [Siminovitchia sediminis]|uniref:DUF2529 domain-containing protein n=1 Tax=Siminovitchia sediminis TaxID=1274353 RepID=A0ABW4KKP8_9BACI
MLKMLSTQLTGIFMKIKDKEELALEDGARLLAQAHAGEGTIYIEGFDEMEGVVLDALKGPEPMRQTARYRELDELTPADRVLLFSRFSDSPKALDLGRKLAEHHTPFVSVSAVTREKSEELSQLADVHIDTHAIRPILPAEDGSRVVFPSLITALFIYHALKVTVDEILSEYE